MKKMYFIAATWLAFSLLATAQNLNPGDVVVIGYAADTGTTTTSIDEFSWVPLVNLPEGTKLYFTDAGYNSADGNFMGTGQTEEILLRYIAPAGGVAAGTVFTLTQDLSLPADYTYIPGSKFGADLDHALSLPNAGDQITIFQSADDENNPLTFGNTSFNALFMVTGSTTVFESLTAGMSSITPAFDIDNLTNLAPGLTNAVNAVAVGTGPLQADETDNARYVGPASGTRDEILFAVSQLSNWSRHDVAFGNDLEFGTAANGWTTNGVSQFTISGLGVKDVSGAQNIQLYPNPSEGKFLLSNASGEKVESIRIYNASGQLLHQIGASQTLDLSNFPKGFYFAEIKLENQTKAMVKKLIRK